MPRPGRVEVLWDQWHYFNRKFFGGKLTPPKAIRITSATSYDGMLKYKGTKTNQTDFSRKDQVKILLSTHQSAKAMTGTLLHEMVHQYQLQVLEIDPEHCPVFQSYSRWIERMTGFRLRVTELA